MRGTGPARMHVPDDLVELVKPVAESDGLTVASWMRHLARREATRRRGGFVVQAGPVDIERLTRELRRRAFIGSDLGES